MKHNIKDLKPILYDILKSSTQSNDNTDVAVTQQMGVSITNAMKKEGVNIIQLQNVHNETLIPKVIEALQKIDSIAEELNMELINITPEPERIEYRFPTDPIDALIEHIYDHKINLNDLRDIIKIRYYEFMKEKLNSSKNALEYMGISRGSISVSLRKLREHKQKGNTIDKSIESSQQSNEQI